MLSQRDFDLLKLSAEMKAEDDFGEFEEFWQGNRTSVPNLNPVETQVAQMPMMAPGMPEGEGL